MTLAYVFIGVGIGWFSALILTGFFEKKEERGQDNETK